MDNFRNQSCDFKKVFDVLPLNIMIVNMEGNVSYTNKSFQMDFRKDCITGIKEGPGDLISCTNSFKSAGGCGHSEECKECLLRQYINQAIKGKKRTESSEIQFALEGDFGKEVKWFDVHIIPELLFEQELILLCFSDITIYKKTSMKLLQNKKMAEATNRAKSEFLANMSHEIRTPLNGMIGMLEMTLLSDLEEEQKDNLTIARNCADNLLGLINNVLDISKIESNRVQLEDRAFDMREMVKNIEDMHKIKIMDKHLEWVCNIEENVPQFLAGDSFRLQQVLNNLISNAVKFTEQGAIKLDVKSLCKSNGMHVINFAVEDSGIGIAPREMRYLFKPFSQVDGSITRKYGGTGLGLAISQSLVQIMGGEIKVKSQKDLGTVFYFTVQMKEEAEKEEEKGEVPKEKEMKPEKILVVEDDRANQMVVGKMLDTMGYRNIDMVGSGFDAIKEMEKKEYDIILMDIQLPEMDGMETTQIIREKEKKTGKQIPIVALTAHALVGDREKFLAKGMTEYVPKPIDTKSLYEVLENIRKKITLNNVYQSLGIVSNALVKPEEEVEKRISNSDKRLFATILKEMKACVEKDEKIGSDYILIEKHAHEIKVKAERTGYDKVKVSAFRLELAARKKDAKSSQKIYNDIANLIK